MSGRSKRSSLRVVVSETVTADTANTVDKVNTANEIGKFKQIKLSIQ